MGILTYFFFLLLIMTPGHCGGKWTSTLLQEGVQKGNTYAAQKVENYQENSPLLKSFQVVLAQDCILILNKKMVLEVVQMFFKKKHDKWMGRTNFPMDANPTEIITGQSTIKLKAALMQLLIDGKNAYSKYSNISELCKYFMWDQNNFFAQIHVDSELFALINYHYFIAKESPCSELLPTVTAVLKNLNTQKYLNQRKNIYNFLINQQHQIIEDCNFNIPPIVKPAVYVIDTAFRGLNSNNFRILRKSLWDCITPWNGGEFLDEHIPVGHGDCMGQIIDQFSRVADVIGWSCFDLVSENGVNLLKETMAKHHPQGPYVLNASLYLSNQVVNWLNKDESGIKYAPENVTNRFFYYYKPLIEKVLKDRNNDSPYLHEEELKQIVQACKEFDQQSNTFDFNMILIGHLRELINYRDEQRTVANLSPVNIPGRLSKIQAFHNSVMPAFADPLIESHAIIGLNYDLSTGKLEQNSKQAGDYALRAVCCPSAVSGVIEPFTQMPFFHFGGHSAATAMVTAITARVWSYFPSLNYKEIQQAILKGARKDMIANYQPDVHGQGMINFMGAFNVANQILFEKSMAQHAIVPQNFQMPQ